MTHSFPDTVIAFSRFYNLLKREKELEKAKSTPAMPITGTLAVGGRSASHTVFGVEEMLLQVNSDDTIGYVNSQMVRLLEMPNRKLVLGTDLSRWDEGKIGNGVLAALVQVARNSDEPHILEHNGQGTIS